MISFPATYCSTSASRSNRQASETARAMSRRRRTMVTPMLDPSTGGLTTTGNGSLEVCHRSSATTS